MIGISVCLGGAFGAMSRHLLGQYIKNKSSHLSFPLSMIVVNLVGSFTLGLLVGLYEQELIEKMLYFVFGVGFLGAFTTFSTFSMEVVALLKHQNIKKASFYILTTIIGSTSCFMFGYILLL